MNPVRRRQHVFLFAFVLTFLVLDVALFRLLFWRLPNETAWDTAPLYNYERLARQLESRKATNEYRVIVAGSSIAHYAIDPDVLAREITAAGNGSAAGRAQHKQVRVEILAFQGQHPLHLRAAAGRLRDARPDLVLLPLGFVDFRPERPLVLGLADQLQTRARDFTLQQLKQDLLYDQRFRVIAPLGWLRHYGGSLDSEYLATGLLAGAFASYRYKFVLGEPAALLLENRFSRGRHYHHYAGQPVGGGNVFHRGWTGSKFSLDLNAELARAGLWLESPPELMRAAESSGRAPKLTLFYRRKSDDSEQPGSRREIELQSGWQRIAFGDAEAGGDPDLVVHFEVEPVWDSNILGPGLGLRLAARAGRAEYGFRGRELRREDQLYRDFSLPEYRASFERRMRRFDRVGMEYLQSLEQARRFWAGRSFDEGLPAFGALRDWLIEMQSAEIPVVLIIAPENPLSVGLYGDSAWYAGFREFLGRLPAAGLIDARDLLGERDFYDHHHPSFYGARKLSEFLGRQPLVTGHRARL